jgi:putative transposase
MVSGQRDDFSHEYTCFMRQGEDECLHGRFLQAIDSGSLRQNGHNESCNGVFRDACLGRWLFATVQEALRISYRWLEEYNYERPHGALDGRTLVTFAAHPAYLWRQPHDHP